MPVNPRAFIGFPDGKVRPVAVPDLFFTDLLPQIDDLAELKLTLHCFWLLNEQSGEYRYLRGADLREDARLLDSLRLDGELRTPEETLEYALERAVTRNTLLRLDVTLTQSSVEPGAAVDSATAIVEDWYFMNTVKGRQAIALIRQGRLRDVQSVLPDEARLRVQRPNIFELYEQNVGVLTPLIADQLRDMEKTYAPEWVHDAFEIAISRNKRNLRYIQTILKRWETEGRDGDRHEEAGRDSEERRRRSYIPDEYSDAIIG
ncbi:MAG TPA: DnaD domain protein [Caldilineaceae bacterium]|nr:DnaD domain protein [Caldilineaceae bacterium]